MPEILTDVRDDGVAVVTISHPERRNACTQSMWEGLGVRDRWTTRLVRSATWSPVR